MPAPGPVQRTLELSVALLAALGVIGALRQRSEARAARSGRRARATAAADLPTSGPTGPVAARLSTWVPPRPRTAAGRAAAWAWSGPLTAVGLLVAASSGRRPRWDPVHGCFVAADMRGPSAVLLRAVGADANTIGLVVLSHRPTLSATLLAHEAVHVRQAERLGPLLVPLYAWGSARHGYRDHPLERAARLGARQAIREDADGHRPPR